MSKKSGLGRGLDALISDASTILSNQESNNGKQVQEPIASINEVDIDLVEVNPFQPRRDFDENSLNELSESIRQLGLIQPITVRKTGNKFQLISGERRYRASKRAGLLRIPAYVREADDEGMLVMALVENVQREDLNAIDVASGYQQLIEEFSFTQEQLSSKIGKERSTITNYIRLLKLPPEIQLGIKSKKISMGHARAILGADESAEQIRIFQRIVKEDLSVRKVEDIVRKINKQPAEEVEKTNHHDEQFMREFDDVQNRLSGIFGETIEFHKSQKGTGKIIISFKSEIELNHILSILEQK
jgi:ParB family transcriptional regulator, chromosome partitioning protein